MIQKQQFVYTTYSAGILSLQFSWTMNNRLSYCGFVDAKIRASDKDLPVPEKEASKNETKKFWITQCLFQEKSLILLHSTTHFYSCIVTLVVLRTIRFKAVVYLVFFLEESGTKKVIHVEFSQIE